METTWMKTPYKLYVAGAMNIALRHLRLAILFFALALFLFIHAPKIITGVTLHIRHAAEHKSLRYDRRNLEEMENEIIVAKKSLIDNSSPMKKRRLSFGWGARNADKLAKPEENWSGFKNVPDNNQKTNYAEIQAYNIESNRERLQHNTNTDKRRMIEESSNFPKHSRLNGGKEQAKIPSNRNKDSDKINPGKLVTKRKFWLQSFTKEIPEDLLIILEDILLREHERISNISNVESEGRDNSGRCKRGYFQLKGMKTCVPWLKCDQVMKLETTDIYGNGVGKIVSPF